MNKQELVAGISEKSGLTKKDSEAALKGFLETVEEALVAGDKVQLVGFGTFATRVKEAQPEKEGRNPSNGQPMIIPAQPRKNVPTFKFGKSIKEAIESSPI